MQRRRTRLVPLVLLTLAACATSDGASSDGASDEPAAVTTADSATTTPSAPTTPTSTATSSSSTTTSSTTTTTTTIAIPDSPGPLDLSAAVVGLGRSVEGRPIVAERFGTPGGRRVLVIGTIHGDEAAGTAILDDLRSAPVPDGVELWLVDSMNPDGQAAQVRQNANGVDLNRNFPDSWGPIGVPGDSQYAGTGPASEPETQAIVNLVEQLRPDVTVWYHQDLFVISPAQGREGRIRQRYAELTDWPMGGISGGTYTGIAATWARHELADQDGVAFIVELGPTLSPADAALHADAIRTIGIEG